MILNETKVQQLSDLIEEANGGDGLTLPASFVVAAWLDEKFDGVFGRLAAWVARVVEGSPARRVERLAVVGVKGRDPVDFRKRDFRAQAVVAVRVPESFAGEFEFVGWRLTCESEPKRYQQADLFGVQSFVCWLRSHTDI